MALALVIPTIGVSPYLRVAVASALRQTTPFTEIIVWGNGVPRELLHEYLGENAELVRIETTPLRLPPHQSWNEGVNRTTTTHVMLLGDDDILCPTAHQAALDLLAQAPLATLGFEIINAVGRVCDHAVSAARASTPEEFYRRIYLGGIALMLSGVAFEKARFLRVGGFVPNPFKSGWFIDTDCWARLAFDAGRVAHGQEVTWQYRVNIGQLGFKASLGEFTRELTEYLPLHRAWALAAGVPEREILGGDTAAYCQRLLRIRATSSLCNRLMNDRLPGWRMLVDVLRADALRVRVRLQILWRAFRFGLAQVRRNWRAQAPRLPYA